MGLASIAIDNLLSPMVLFFLLGVLAAAARSDLSIPESIGKAMALYLMFAIGFKGGAGVSAHGVGADLLLAMAFGVLLSFAIPVLAFALLRLTTGLSRVDAAAVAAHYGSISVVTFVAATEALKTLGISYDGYMVAVVAIMETPAIVAALWLVRRSDGNGSSGSRGSKGALSGEALREVLFNGSVVLLMGAFFIGWITGEDGLEDVAPLIVDPFKGVLCLFLLDMGLVAARGFRSAREALNLRLFLFGIYMPLIGAALATIVVSLLDMSPGSAALMVVLAASASYIAVPAAMRLTLPEARPAIYLTMSLGVTFPFNLVFGIPLYIAAAGWVAG